MNHEHSAAAQRAAFETAVLSSGMRVLVRPMPGFSGIHAVCGTAFGSVDLAFEANGRRVQVPAGTAHFLEHKMFESEEGDAFALYAKTGASANAFTSFDKTCYLFTCTDHFEENLAILLGLVSKPYFTAQTIAKEQGIIGQEIKMYEDSPEWRLVFGVYQGLYGAHPVREDIAGTVGSIAQLTPQLLYACTDAFYSPGQMVLAVAGNVTLAQVVAAAEKTPFAKPTPSVRRLLPQEPAAVAVADSSIRMDVAKPLVGIGFKVAPPCEGAARLHAEMAAEVLAELVCGSMTPLYRTLYDENLAGPDFSGEVLSVPGAFSILFGGETEDPVRVRTLLMDEIDRLARDGVEEELFRLCKNQMYGELLAGLENVEDAATGLLSAWLRGRTPAQELEALAALTRQDVEHALHTMLTRQNSAVFTIYPRETQEAEQ